MDSNSILNIQWWQIILIIVCLTLGIAFLIYFTTKLKGINSISLGNIFKFNSDKDASNCPSEEMLHSALTILNNISTEIYSIKYRNTISSQMHKAEEYLLQIKDNALNTVGKEIKEALQSKHTVTAHGDYLNFKLALQECMARMKDIIRGTCLNNGFSKLDAKDFDTYVTGIIERISNMARNFFSENLVMSLIDVDEILDADILMEELLKQMYVSILIIAVRKEDEVKNLIKQRNDIVETTWGIKCSVEDNNV
jgi:hypothetical protein